MSDTRRSHVGFQPSDAFMDSIEALLDGSATPEQRSSLGHILAEDPEARKWFTEYVQLHAALTWGMGELGDGAVDSASVSHSLPFGFPSSLLDSPVTQFSSGWLLAYLIATVVIAVGLIVGSRIPASYPAQVARKSYPATEGPVLSGPGTQFVGRITGMVDCRCAEKAAKPVLDAPVPMGREYSLASGLVEITYATGAKVILQGPVTYKVQSENGGFLSIGKLTARIEKKGEGGRRKGEKSTEYEVRSTEEVASGQSSVASGQWLVASSQRSEIRNQKSEIGNRKSQIPNPKSQISSPPSRAPRLPSPFVVHTPTATVTDLGTEFGVEVDKRGITTSHVFRGSVTVQALDVRTQAGPCTTVLHENETVQTERPPGDGHIALHRINIDPRTFVRRVVQTPKPLDLLDIVAGGYGTLGRRERGINPANGMEVPFVEDVYRPSDGTYRPVEWHKLIDGVFAFSNGAKPAVLDSEGHTFEFLPRSVTTAWTSGSIWARAAELRPESHTHAPGFWPYAMGEEKQYMPDRRGLLCMHANAGITFNLAAMRETYPGTRPARFRAVAGAVPSATQEGLADIWVFVDGRVKLKRTPLRSSDGIVRIDLELAENDRFLTLVTAAVPAYRNPSKTVVFGDPVLERTPVTPSEIEPYRK
jgi:hypothetical protein